jgi:exonuclease I
MRIGIFDFEATDVDVKTARIVDVAVGIYDSESGKLLHSYSAMVSDQTYSKMHEDASLVTGITDELLRRVVVTPDEALLKLISYLSLCDYVCGHNIKKYDIPLALEEFKRNKIENYTFKNVIDTRTDLIYPRTITTRKLQYLALEMGIPVVTAHAAMADVMTTAALLFTQDIEKIIARSKSPDLYVQASVSYEHREKAKSRQFFFDTVKKIWVKQLKECDYEKEKESYNFHAEILKNYIPPS